LPGCTPPSLANALPAYARHVAVHAYVAGMHTTRCQAAREAASSGDEARVRAIREAWRVGGARAILATPSIAAARASSSDPPLASEQEVTGPPMLWSDCVLASSQPGPTRISTTSMVQPGRGATGIGEHQAWCLVVIRVANCCSESERGQWMLRMRTRRVRRSERAPSPSFPSDSKP
jgi:hypothetical protein